MREKGGTEDSGILFNGAWMSIPSASRSCAELFEPCSATGGAVLRVGNQTTTSYACCCCSRDRHIGAKESQSPPAAFMCATAAVRPATTNASMNAWGESPTGVQGGLQRVATTAFQFRYIASTAPHPSSTLRLRVQTSKSCCKAAKVAAHAEHILLNYGTETRQTRC